MLLVLLHGLPASGKTTLGKQLAAELKLPFLSRDAYKELSFDVLGEGTGDIEWSQKLGELSFESVYLTMELIFAAGGGCVVETFWKPEFSEPRLRDLIARYGVKCVQIFCTADMAALEKRFEERASSTRHAAHMDTKRLEVMGYIEHFNANRERNQPLKLPGGLITVDTTHFSSIDSGEIVRKIVTVSS